MRTRFTASSTMIAAAATITVAALAGDCNNNGVPDDEDVFGVDLLESTEYFLDWADADDDDDSGVVALPFPLTMGGVDFVAFVQDSNGYVELLAEGEEPYYYTYGYAWDLVNETNGSGIEHTYLMAAYDDLSSYYAGFFGYRLEDERIVFTWNTETYCDEDYGLPNDIQLTLDADGTVQWNFGLQTYDCYDYDLYTGVFLGHDVNTFHEAVSGVIPELASWSFHERTGVMPVPYEYEGQRIPIDWTDSDDDNYSDVIALPWPVTLGGETFTAFVQDSNGYVELLRDGDSPLQYGYGAVDDLTEDTDADGNTHTFLMAAYDDLDSSDYGYYGYDVEADHVSFTWVTPTYSDDSSDLMNRFQITLLADGAVRWDFDWARYEDYDYDLFTGVYLGYDQQKLVEIVSGDIPAQESWRWVEHGIADPTSEDTNNNGIPDECESLLGDLDGDLDVDGADLGLLLGSWGECPECPADLNGDGVVDGADLGLQLGNWTG